MPATVYLGKHDRKPTQGLRQKQGFMMDLTNYVDVPERFRQALQRWPELRVMENRPEIITIGDKTFISVTMQIWRTPDDPIPAQATCFEPFPGKTSFTRDSEQMNASTSCLGRCLGPSERPYAGARRKCEQCTIGSPIEVPARFKLGRPSTRN